MTKPEPQNAQEWFDQADLQHKKGEYEAALLSFDRVLDLDPQNHPAWYYRGNTLRKLGCNRDAIASFDKALELKPNYENAWNNRGLALSELEKYDKAIASFDKALELKPDYANFWNNKGNAFKDLHQYDDAIECYKKALQLSKNQYWRACKNLGWAFFNSKPQRYKEALDNFDNGWRNLDPTKNYYQEGYGELHYAKGHIQYLYGISKEDPLPHLLDAAESFKEALLSVNQFSDRYLEILEKYIIVCRLLNNIEESDRLLNLAISLLEQRIEDTSSDSKKIRLACKFNKFYQLRVDAQLSEGKLESALELAEERKNLCLSWMQENRYSKELTHSPKYRQIDRLLNAQTCVIYWHLSPAVITTFIVKKDDIQVISAQNIPEHPAATDKRLQEFEDWLKEWKKDYQRNRQNAKEDKKTLLDKMKHWLDKLPKILQIEEILEKIGDEITHLILIPHRDLHLLPLHYLFFDKFTITYLPSFQIGLNLQTLSPEEGKLLNVPDTCNDLPFAKIESVAISSLFTDDNQLEIPNPTQQELLGALKANTGYFHFTGHGYHQPEHPRKSALVLSESDEKLTLGNIFDDKDLDLSKYKLICLSACETGITSKDNLLDEYVGLASGFLAKQVSYVVSTLWRVDERSTALLIIEFYELLNQSKPPAEALKEAQNWLHNVTYQDLAQWYRDLGSKLKQRDRQSSIYLETEALIIESDKTKMESTEPPYAHPYYWAGFILTGKTN